MIVKGCCQNSLAPSYSDNRELSWLIQIFAVLEQTFLQGGLQIFLDWIISHSFVFVQHSLHFNCSAMFVIVV